MNNIFTKVSKVNITTKNDGHKCILDDVYFTAPFKIMRPFYIEDDYVKVMIMSSSAGIMAGDNQEYNINVGSKTKLEITSQSYEKIHKMMEGKATRKCEINVGKNAFLKYNPQPVIPFAKSYFENILKFNLEDRTSRFVLVDIISCGRSNSGEKFEYDCYKSFLEVRCEGRLIYRDNTLYEPEKINMSGYGFFEGYTHLANIFIANFEFKEEVLDNIEHIINNENEVNGGISITKDNNISIKILGYSGQKLSDLSEKIISLFEI